VNVSSATTSSTNNFLANKLNNTQQQQQQSSQLYQQQATMAPRFMNNYNPLSPTTTTLTNQIKQSLTQNSISLGQQQQQHNMQSNNFNAAAAAAALNTSNLLYPLNLNNLNLNAVLNSNSNNSNNNNNTNNSNNSNQFQHLTNPTLLASVLAANTTCSLNNTLFVGNLHASLQEMDLVQVFRPFGRIVECCKKWLHFGFVKFTSEEEACHAYVTLNGFRLKGRPMRLEFQNRTKKARIKAIIAQATLQATANNNNDAVDSSLSSLGVGGCFPGFMTNDEQRQLNAVNLQFTNQINIGIPSNNTNNSKNIIIDSFHSTGSSSLLLANDCTFFDSDQLMKFAQNGTNPSVAIFTPSNMTTTSSNTATDLDLEPKMKKFSDDFNQFFDLNEKCSFNETSTTTSTKTTGENNTFNLGSFKSSSSVTSGKSLSPTSDMLADSPQHDTSSSDSGCRSTSSLAEEDSGIASIQTNSSSKCTSLLLTGNGNVNALTMENLKTLDVLENQKLTNKLEVVHQHQHQHHDQLSDHDDDDDCVSNSDTSDDASEIPTDSEVGLENDLDLLDEIDTLSVEQQQQQQQCQECAIGENGAKSKYNQLIEKDGTLVRKKLDFGVYRSINQTFSLFIEPQDILKKLDSDEYEEYVLFPNGMDMIDSYFIIKNNRIVA